jgi:hypothetical protein
MHRAAAINPKGRVLTSAEIRKLLELGVLRIWSLKTHLYEQSRRLRASDYSEFIKQKYPRINLHGKVLANLGV